MPALPADICSVQLLEEAIDRIHADHPAMHANRIAGVMEMIVQTEILAKQALRGLSGGQRVRSTKDLLAERCAALDQCLTWLSKTPYNHALADPPDITEEQAIDFLWLALRYVRLSVVFTAWHRGETLGASIDSSERIFRAVLPRRLAIYHTTAMRFHNAPIPHAPEESLQSSRSELLAAFSGNLGAIMPSAWRKAFDALYEIASFDWDCDSQMDLGGFSFPEIRRASVSLRLWSELLIFSGGVCRLRTSDFLNLLAQYSEISLPAAQAIFNDMAFNLDAPQGKADNFPLVRLDENQFTWSPMKVFIQDHCRDLLARLAIRNRRVHDAISGEKHKALIEQLRLSVVPYASRLSFVANVPLPDTDLDVAIIDNFTGVYLCLEAKAMRTPRTLREAFDVDGRKRNGQLNDGLLKGATIQVPKVLRYAAVEPADFMMRLSRVATVELPTPSRILGGVISTWTFGTGAADDQQSQPPHQPPVPVITVPVWRNALDKAGGDLEAAFKAISSGEHLVVHDSIDRPQRLDYGGWLFEWSFAG